MTARHRRKVGPLENLAPPGRASGMAASGPLGAVKAENRLIAEKSRPVRVSRSPSETSYNRKGSRSSSSRSLSRLLWLSTKAFALSDGPGVLECDQLPEFSRDQDAPILRIILREDRPSHDRNAQVLDVHILVDGIFELAPKARPPGLVVTLMMGCDVREEEGVTLGAFRLLERSPTEVGPSGDVAPIELVVLVNLVAGLELGKGSLVIRKLFDRFNFLKFEPSMFQLRRGNLRDLLKHTEKCTYGSRWLPPSLKLSCLRSAESCGTGTVSVRNRPSYPGLSDSLLELGDGWLLEGNVELLKHRMRVARQCVLIVTSFALAGRGMPTDVGSLAVLGDKPYRARVAALADLVLLRRSIRVRPDLDAADASHSDTAAVSILLTTSVRLTIPKVTSVVRPDLTT